MALLGIGRQLGETIEEMRRVVRQGLELFEQRKAWLSVLVLFAEPGDDHGSGAVDAGHEPDLITPLSLVLLIDADGVYPELLVNETRQVPGSKQEAMKVCRDMEQRAVAD